MNNKDYIYNPKSFRGSRYLNEKPISKGYRFGWLLIGFIVGCITMLVLFEKAPNVIQKITNLMEHFYG